MRTQFHQNCFAFEQKHYIGKMYLLGLFIHVVWVILSRIETCCETQTQRLNFVFLRQ